jgi:hypothetical protein
MSAAVDKATARDIVPIVRANVDKASKFMTDEARCPSKRRSKARPSGRAPSMCSIWHVFDLEGHPRAARAYAWSHLVGETGERRRFFAVLHLGGIRSPVDAVRVAIVAENKGRR